MTLKSTMGGTPHDNAAQGGSEDVREQPSGLWKTAQRGASFQAGKLPAKKKEERYVQGMHA